MRPILLPSTFPRTSSVLNLPSYFLRESATDCDRYVVSLAPDRVHSYALRREFPVRREVRPHACNRFFRLAYSNHEG
jgi:hypothetical protein